jgi:hypothetical protein
MSVAMSQNNNNNNNSSNNSFNARKSLQQALNLNLSSQQPQPIQPQPSSTLLNQTNVNTRQASTTATGNMEHWQQLLSVYGNAGLSPQVIERAYVQAGYNLEDTMRLLASLVNSSVSSGGVLQTSTRPSPAVPGNQAPAGGTNRGGGEREGGGGDAAPGSGSFRSEQDAFQAFTTIFQSDQLSLKDAEEVWMEMKRECEKAKGITLEEQVEIASDLAIKKIMDSNLNNNKNKKPGESTNTGTVGKSGSENPGSHAASAAFPLPANAKMHTDFPALSATSKPPKPPNNTGGGGGGFSWAAKASANPHHALPPSAPQPTSTAKATPSNQGMIPPVRVIPSTSAPVSTMYSHLSSAPNASYPATSASTATPAAAASSVLKSIPITFKGPSPTTQHTVPSGQSPAPIPVPSHSLPSHASNLSMTNQSLPLQPPTLQTPQSFASGSASASASAVPTMKVIATNTGTGYASMVSASSTTSATATATGPVPIQTAPAGTPLNPKQIVLLSKFPCN